MSWNGVLQFFKMDTQSQRINCLEQMLANQKATFNQSEKKALEDDYKHLYEKCKDVLAVKEQPVNQEPAKPSS